MQSDADLFASLLNAQLDFYVSWFPQPLCWKVSTFSFRWYRLKSYVIPSFSLINKYLEKLRHARQARLVLVAEIWTGQVWHPTLLERACDNLRIIRSDEALLTASTGQPHPLIERNSLLMAAWKLLGIASECGDFRKKWLRCLWKAHVNPVCFKQPPSPVG